MPKAPFNGGDASSNNFTEHHSFADIPNDQANILSLVHEEHTDGL